MGKSQTIDNLSIDNNIYYAQQHADQDTVARVHPNESRGVSQFAQSDVMAPFAINQYDQLFNTNQKNTPWSIYEMPTGYDSQSRRIFMKGQVAPSLGSTEMLENCQRRIESQMQTIKAEPGSSSSLMNETLQGGESLVKTIQLINEFDRTSSIVLSESNRFKKG
jgi:hypothetical protein